MQIVRAGNYAYFSAQTANHATELWKTDGTNAGTSVLIRTGRVSNTTWGIDPSSFAAVGSELYFLVSNGHTSQLWKTNGTKSGTVFVHAVLIGPGPDYHFNTPWLFGVGNLLYFEAYSAGRGKELWESNGSFKGTFMVKDINPGPADSTVQPLASMGSTLFLSANDGSHGTELWKTNGTAAGTVMVDNIASDSPGHIRSSDPSDMTVAGNEAFFMACDRVANPNCGSGGGSPNQLWKTDGTAEGTVKIAHIDAVEGPRYIGTDSAGKPIVLIVGYGKIWKSDGTPVGTRVFDAGTVTGDYITPVVEGPHPLAFFVGLTGPRQSQLWETDGTVAGTKSLGAISPSFLAPATLQGKPGIIFAGGNSATGNQPWFSSGTVSGTSMIKRLVVGTQGSNIDEIMTAGGKAFFAMNYVPECFPLPHRTVPCPSQSDLYASNGAAAGTLLLKKFTWAWSYAAVGSDLVFVTDDPKQGLRLWRSDGTVTGTREVVRLGAYRQNRPAEVLAAGSRAFVMVGPDHLWVTDGTSSGTHEIASVADLATDGWISAAVSHGILYFAAKGSANAYGLWRSDGTARGTRRIWSVAREASGSTTPSSITPMRWGVFFEARAAQAQSFDLWSLDAKSGKASFVKRVRYQGQSYPTLAEAGSRVFFNSYSHVDGAQLWSYDGSRHGLRLLKTFSARLKGVSIEQVTPVGKEVYFDGNDGMHGNELWKSDGTASGTVMVKDIWPGVGSSNPLEMTPFDGRVYFAANDGTHGIELWSTNGARSETSMVEDIYPGSVSSYPYGLTVAGGKLFFAATDPLHGEELWAL
jgi:ELWxxDGT repeat protein